ncbi:MAG: asparagine synthase [Rhodospirillaceae bacterium]|nr:MAG: asparagine synthase [Rhodospirillaceae bacterium]
MCGLAGLLNLDGAAASPTVVRAMTDLLAHRGPDGEGQYTDGALGLGHRRLAIIDLSPAGRQPMATPDDRFVIAYNGEVYNFQELRATLQALGHRFQSRTDTEVVLHGFARWGTAVLPRLNGMFAFAVWDRAERRLTLARDRYGIKPLYTWRRGNTVLFASEIKAMRAHPAFRAEMDSEALMEYMTFQNYLGERTLFRDVRLLPPGCALIMEADGRARQERYWDFDFREPDTYRPIPEYEDHLDGLFRQAVNRQLVSDVPVGSYLSGGMDSGSITAVAAGQIPCLSTFTVGFDLHSASGLEMGYDERSSAEYMSYMFKTEHYEMVLKAGDMERCMKRLVWHLEEPRVGQSYPNFYAAKLASRFGKVVLAGTGGDELFGGYPWRYYRAVVNDDFEHYIDKYYAFWQRLLPDGAIRNVFRPLWDQVRHVRTRDLFRDVFTHHAQSLTRPEDYINHSLYFEAKTFLHGLLVVEDKLSMAHGLENRVPFLDNDLVDFAMRVPVGLKLGNLNEVVRLNENEPGDKTRKFFEQSNDGKLILRRVMARHIPDDIAKARKQGFSAPDASWFRGESIDYVRDALFNPRARIYDFLDPAATRALIEDHLAGRQNRRLLIWSLLNLEEWCHAFLGAGGQG